MNLTKCFSPQNEIRNKKLNLLRIYIFLHCHYFNDNYIFSFLSKYSLPECIYNFTFSLLYKKKRKKKINITVISKPGRFGGEICLIIIKIKNKLVLLCIVGVK